MSREVESVYGCFRCGALQGSLSWSSEGDDKRTRTSALDVGDERPWCGECGERSIVTVRQALDMLNELYLTGRRKDVEEAMEYDTYEIQEREESED